MTATFDGDGVWAIVELMGHRQLAGWVQDVEAFGTRMVHVAVPLPCDPPEDGARWPKPEWRAAQLYAPSALYCLTPVDEGVARRAAARAYTPVLALASESVAEYSRDGSDDDDDIDDPGAWDDVNDDRCCDDDPCTCNDLDDGAGF